MLRTLLDPLFEDYELDEADETIGQHLLKASLHQPRRGLMH
ncbi:MAG: hypothetical protein ACOC32_02955 [Nanoarchaeota archaeon]